MKSWRKPVRTTPKSGGVAGDVFVDILDDIALSSGVQGTIASAHIIVGTGRME